MSYEIENIMYSPGNHFVHKRNLGHKMSGSHLYPNVSWSDVVLQDVPIEVPMHLSHQDWLIGQSLDQDQDPTTVIVGDRQSGPGSDIQISESECRNAMFEPDDSGWSGWMSDSECKRLYNRMKYEVKPRNKEKENRNKYFKHNL